MSSHAKASPVGSVKRRLGSLLAVLAFSLCVLGSGAPSALAAPPTVTIENASNVTFTTAKVKATVDPHGLGTLYRFQYISETAFQANLSNSLPGFEGATTGIEEFTETAKTVEPELAGLAAGTTYHLRIQADNSDGQTEAVAAATFATPAATAPTVAINPPGEIKYTRAQISGSIDPEGGNSTAGDPLPIAWELQYSADPLNQGWSFGANGTISGPAAKSSSPIAVPAPATPAQLQGLLPNTEYKFRLVAFYAGLTAVSSEGSFTTSAVSPPAVSADDATVVTGTTAHFSGSVTAGETDPGFDSSCAFDYVPDAQFQVDGFGGAKSIDCNPNPVTGTAATPVQANPIGLEPNTVYHRRLRATNQGGQSIDDAANFKTEKVAPTVQTLSTSRLDPGSAVLTANVNPHHSTVTYQFEWGTSAGYGNLAPASPAPLGPTDNAPHLVGGSIAGLQEGATYHFRIVATNTETGATAQGADRVFTTSTSAGPSSCSNEQLRAETDSLALPECRAYELVMPAAKDFPFGANASETAVASADGNAVAYATFGPMPGSKAGTQQNINVARHGAGGWVNTPISPLETPLPNRADGPVTQGFSEDLSAWYFQSRNPPLTPGAAFDVVNVYRGDTQTQDYTLLTPGETGSSGLSPFNEFAGASADSTHFYVEAYEPLLPGGPTNALYEMVNGQLRLVSVLPNGSPTLGHLGMGQGGRGHAISEDGSKVVWWDGGALYDRINGTTTVEITASQRSVVDPTGTSPTFWGASIDGDKVFFTSQAALTNSATLGSGANLYVYDVSSGILSDLTAAPDARVEGVVGNSDDGEYVYFVARGALDGAAEDGKANLYIAHAGAVTYIGALDSDADKGAWGSTITGIFQEGLTARVTPDGRRMAIQSVMPLTGYNNTSAANGLPTKQVYLYSADTDSLVCVSCRPDGSAPVGDSTITPPDFAANVTRNLSDDGSRVFFNSTDAIVPADINGKMDVYEWSGGKVHLISPGTGNFDSHFQDAGRSGNDVIFSTVNRLVGQDTDEHDDLYDARVGGGFPRPAFPEPPCEGEACRGQGSSAPASEAPVTPSFEGPPNPSPKKTSSKGRAKALKACKRKKGKKQRKKCESQVKKRFDDKSGRGK